MPGGLFIVLQYRTYYILLHQELKVDNIYQLSFVPPFPIVCLIVSIAVLWVYGVVEGNFNNSSNKLLNLAHQAYLVGVLTYAITLTLFLLISNFLHPTTANIFISVLFIVYCLSIPVVIISTTTLATLYAKSKKTTYVWVYSTLSAMYTIMSLIMIHSFFYSG